MRNSIAGSLRAPRRPKRTLLCLTKLEDRETPAAAGFSALGAAAGAAPVVSVLRPGGSVLARITAYDPAFTGGVNVAVNEIDGNANTIELVTGAGAGGGPHVKVYAVDTVTGATNLLTEFMAYDINFHGGVNVAAGNLNNNLNSAAIVTAPGVGGGPDVRVYSFANGTLTPLGGQLGAIMAFDQAFRGGANVAVGDFDGNAINGDELAIAAGPGGGPHVKVFGSDGSQIANFMAFDPAFRGGAAFGTPGINGQLVVISGPGATGSSRFSFANGVVTPTVLTPFTLTTPGVSDQAGNVFGLTTPVFGGITTGVNGLPPAGSTTPVAGGFTTPGAQSPFGVGTGLPGLTTASAGTIGTIPGTTFNTANNTVPGFISGGFVNSNGQLVTNGTTFGPSTFGGSTVFPAGSLTPGVASGGVLGPGFGSLPNDGGTFTNIAGGPTVFAFQPNAFMAPSPSTPPVPPSAPTPIGPFGPIV
ncbi:MAG: hypothetical protein U0746_11390 [Gemmataceae bacterium]